MALTAKQRAFVREYQKDRNATQAAIRAGYAKSNAESTGCHLTRNPKVAAELARLEAEASEVAKLDRAWVLERLQHEAKTAESDSARVKAIELIGKAVDGGLFTDKKQVEGTLGLVDLLGDDDGNEDA